MDPKPTSDATRRISRVLRKRSTLPEAILWRHLRNRSFEGYKFRRQQPIGRYVIDFYCSKARLAIEVDGSGHLTPIHTESDRERTEYLSSAGIRMLHFWNTDIMDNLDLVLTQIQDAIEGQVSRLPAE